MVNNQIWTCYRRPPHSSHLIMCTAPSAGKHTASWLFCVLFLQNETIVFIFETTTVLTTSALLRSRVSHMKPWGKEYGSCLIFSLSASIGPWLVTTSSAQTAQLLSNYLKLFSNHLILLKQHLSWADTKNKVFQVWQHHWDTCLKKSKWHLPLLHRRDTSANSCHGNQLNVMPQSMPRARTPTVLHSWHVFGTLLRQHRLCQDKTSRWRWFTETGNTQPSAEDNTVWIGDANFK